MSQEVLNLITSIVLAIIGAAVPVITTYVIQLLNSKIKNDKARELLSGALNIVADGVDYVYQTYVQALKGTSFWDEGAMQEANDKAVEYITNNLSDAAKTYILANGKDIEEWIKEQIEIAIKQSKDSNKK